LIAPLPESTISDSQSSPPTAVTWFGHATALIEIAGVRLLTDPTLRGHIGPLVRIAAPVQTDKIGPIDCVLLSHLHADHTHLSSLRAVGRRTPIVAPRPAGAWLERHGLTPVSELAPGEETSIAGVRVAATPAAHDRRRHPLGPEAEPVGYLIGGPRAVYFAGDTDLFDEMADLRGSVDIALLPVAGWGPKLGPGHLDPERAARATASISPSVAIPIHWGTFAPGWYLRRLADPERPAREFYRLARRYAPSVQVRILVPGQRTEL
jgi:L-ascorbate metabolism protein UlaG (beta-lactamase superfamily)